MLVSLHGTKEKEKEGEREEEEMNSVDVQTGAHAAHVVSAEPGTAPTNPSSFRHVVSAEPGGHQQIPPASDMYCLQSPGGTNTSHQLQEILGHAPLVSLPYVSRRLSFSWTI